MSSLSSASTLTEVEAAYDDNAAYAESGSASMARAFCTACRILLRRVAKRTAHGGQWGFELEIDPRVVQQELQQAQAWLASAPAASTDGGVKYTDFSNFRDY